MWAWLVAERGQWTEVVGQRTVRALLELLQEEVSIVILLIDLISCQYLKEITGTTSIGKEVSPQLLLLFIIIIYYYYYLLFQLHLVHDHQASLQKNVSVCYHSNLRPHLFPYIVMRALHAPPTNQYSTDRKALVSLPR